MLGRSATLSTRGQAADGSFSSFAGPGVTSLVTTAILRHGRTPDDPVVARALAYLSTFVQPDGGIYRETTVYRNYETCLAMLCFVEANQDGRYDELLYALLALAYCKPRPSNHDRND